MAKYRIQSPDGVTFEVHAPDTASEQEVMAYAQAEFAKKPAMTMRPTGLQGGAAHGVFQGVRDTVDAAAQLLRHAVPESVGQSFDAADRFIGDKIPGLKFAPTDETVARVNREYDAARSARGRDGLDVARLGGNIAGLVSNPINKLIPTGASTVGRVASGIGRGALGGALTPVTAPGHDFAAQKAAQVGIGAAAGGATSYLAGKVAPTVGRVVDSVRARVSPPGQPVNALGRVIGESTGPAGVAVEARNALQGGKPSIEAQSRVSAAISEINPAARAGTGAVSLGMPQDVFDGLALQVTKSLAKGQDLDARALVRQALAEQTIGAEARLTVGQAGRDPTVFARELNLRGIEGVGQPMQQRMLAQNNALISAVRGNGALPDAYEAGATGLKALADFDRVKAQEVSAAYKAFRQSSGAQADVPFAPVVQKFQQVLDDFGTENIPSAIAKRVGSYMDATGAKQTKLFDLDEANKLLTQINAHYDPTKPAQQAALGQIKAALRDAVDMAAESAPQGADSLKKAIGMARERFQLHDAIPALADVAGKSPAAQEQFVRRYITSPSASVDSVAAMAKVLPAEAMDAIRGAIRRQILADAAPGAELGRDSATISQAALRRALDKIGPRKLQAIMGADEAGKLANIQQVAEWVMKEPAGAAVNRSNTAGAIANLMQRIPGGGVVGVPLKLVQDTAQKLQNESAVRNALAGKASEAAAQLPEAEINALRAYINGFALPAGAAAASSLR